MNLIMGSIRVCLVGILSSAVGCETAAPSATPRSSSRASALTVSTNIVIPGKGTGIHFGNCVEVDGDIAAVGAHYEETVAWSTGAIYLYYRNPNTGIWAFKKKLQPPSVNDAWDRLGDSLAFSGDTLVSGAYFGKTSVSGAGSVYVFERNLGGSENWGQRKEILSPETVADEEFSDLFGSTVDLDGDTLVVGAYLDNVRGEEAGAAYIYERDRGGADNWGLVKTLYSPSSRAGEKYGYSVSILGDLVVVGSPHTLVDGIDKGAVHMYERNAGGTDTWGRVKTLVGSVGAEGDFFGVSVDLDGDLLAVGASGNDEVTTNAGSVFLFARDEGGENTWGEIKRILPRANVKPNAFGNSVEIQDNHTLVIGAERTYGSTAGDLQLGRVYVHERNVGGDNGWGEVMELYRLGGEAYDFFGSDVSISGNTILVGADQAGEDGEGHFYTYVPPDLVTDGETCSADSLCASNHCVDGICCESACGGGVSDDCLACSVAAGSAVDGVCTPVTENTPCGDTSETDCSAPDTCDNAGLCQTNHAPDGSFCDNELPCTLYDACYGGVCEAGVVDTCDDGVDCTVDSCESATGRCVNQVDLTICEVDDPCQLSGCNPVQGCYSEPAADWVVCPHGFCLDGACSDVEAGDSCDTAIPLTLNIPLEQTLAGAHASGITCDSVDPDAVDRIFGIMLFDTETYTVTVTAPENNALTIALLSDCEEGPACTVVLDRIAELTPVDARTHYIAVMGVPADTPDENAFEILVSTATFNDPDGGLDSGVEEDSGDSETGSEEDISTEDTGTEEDISTEDTETGADTETEKLRDSDSGPKTDSENDTETETMSHETDGDGADTEQPQDTFTESIDSDGDAGDGGADSSSSSSCGCIIAGTDPSVRLFDAVLRILLFLDLEM